MTCKCAICCKKVMCFPVLNLGVLFLSLDWYLSIFIVDCGIFLNMYSKGGYWLCFIVCYVSIILLLYICYFWNVLPLSTYTRFANYIFRPSYLWNFESSCCFVWKWCRFLCFAHGWQTREMSGVGFWVAVRNRKVTLPIISVLYCPPCSSSAERRGKKPTLTALVKITIIRLLWAPQVRSTIGSVVVLRSLCETQKPTSLSNKTTTRLKVLQMMKRDQKN